MRLTQKQRLKVFFASRPNQWIPLYEILNLHISQYNARIYDLRAMGITIENKEEWVNGQKHTWFRYVPRERQQVFNIG